MPEFNEFPHRLEFERPSTPLPGVNIKPSRPAPLQKSTEALQQAFEKILPKIQEVKNVDSSNSRHTDPELAADALGRILKSAERITDIVTDHHKHLDPPD